MIFDVKLFTRETHRRSEHVAKGKSSGMVEAVEEDELGVEVPDEALDITFEKDRKK